MDSGYREPKDRITYSLRRNARYQLTVLALGTAGAVYFITQVGFDGEETLGETLKGLVMALAYAWSLVLAIYLMGHGLVAIPRRLIRDASVSGRLKKLQTQAPRVHDKLEEAIEELDQAEGQIINVRQRKSGMKRDLQDWVDELYDTSTLPESRTSTRPAAAAPAVVTERFLAELARKVKRARHKKARFSSEWDNLVQQAVRLQTIIDSSASQRLEFSKKSSPLTILTPYMRYHLYSHIIPPARIALGVVLACLSAVLVWSEVMHPVSSKLSVVGLSVVHHPSSSRGQIGLAGQFIAAFWLLYMCAAALYSVTEVKVWGNRALVRRQTYSESACWYALQVAKLTVPLSYNFITMMPRPIYTEAAFYKFLGRLIELTTLVSGFDQYFRIFILLPVFATLFNLYGKVRNVVGFGVMEDESEESYSGFSTGGWREGRALIERELQNDGAQVNLSSANERLISGISTPPVRASLDNGRSSGAPSGRAIGGARRAPERPPPQEEEDTSDRYFFQDFTERVKNTFDSTDRPAWMRDLGEGFKKPKWMNGDQGDGDGRPGSSDSGNLFGKLFGGGRSSSGGNIRL